MPPRAIVSLFAVFCILAALVYFPSFFASYTYDSNIFTQRLGRENSPGIEILLDRENYGPGTGIMSWRPLTLLTIMVLDFRLFGMNSGFSHALNILLHALNAGLAVLIFEKLRGPPQDDGTQANLERRLPALFAGLLFLLHPIMSEVVLCMGFRFDILSLLFSLLALLVLIQEATLQPLRLIAAGVLFLLALLGKESAAVLLLLAPLLVWWRSGAIRSALLTGATFLAAFIPFFLAWRLFQYQDYPDTYLGGGGRLLGVANFLVASVEIYLRNGLLLGPLRIDHDFLPVATPLAGRVLRALGVLAMMAAGVAWLAKRESFALIGAFWVIAAFGPVSQLVPVPDPIAERFCYFPMVGGAWLGGCIVAGLLGGRIPPKATAVTAVLVLTACAATAHHRSYDWLDDLTLNIRNWSVVQKRTERGQEALASLYLGRSAARARSGDAEGAASDMTAARREAALLAKKYPDNPNGHRLLAVQELAVGNREAALLHAERARQLAPENEAVQLLLQKLHRKD